MRDDYRHRGALTLMEVMRLTYAATSAYRRDPYQRAFRGGIRGYADRTTANRQDRQRRRQARKRARY